LKKSEVIALAAGVFDRPRKAAPVVGLIRLKSTEFRPTLHPLKPLDFNPPDYRGKPVANQTAKKDIAAVLNAAHNWIVSCVVEDHSLFSDQNLWTPNLISDVRTAFVDHPDEGDEDFMSKLKGQMSNAGAPQQQLMAEILWALLLFPSNMKARTKRRQVREIWALSGQSLAEDNPLLADSVLAGIGSGGPGFNNYRPAELEYLLDLLVSIKAKPEAERREIVQTYPKFIQWIETVPRKGSRQYRHMLRYFAFLERVERISSNNDRRRIIEAFGTADGKVTKHWTDQQLDDALLTLRKELEGASPGTILDFYEPPLRAKWLGDREVLTAAGAATVIVPADEDEAEEHLTSEQVQPSARQSIQIQAKLAEIGAIMGLKIWLPAADRGKVGELVNDEVQSAFLDVLPLNYDKNTLGTISQIDVIWLRRQSIVRAFEGEHTTAVYSGLLRMADLLALQPNMKIQLHIVAPDERREKVFYEMRRPVFAYLEAGPLANTCTFISYDSVDAIRSLGSLAHTNESVIKDYEERADETE
jgi:hypothetical protein